MTDQWGTSKPETFPYTCPHCERARLLEVLSRWYKVPQEDDDDWDPHQWTVTRCTTCEIPVLLYQEPDYGGEGWGDYEQVYPETDRQLPASVPKSIRGDFAEAQRCMRARGYTAAAIMARRVVESIRKTQGYPDGSLFSALQKMRDEHKIDPRLYEWADSVREVGNEGAHDTETQVSREDAREVLRFVEALVDYLYVFQQRHDMFKRRRQMLKEGRSLHDLEPALMFDPIETPQETEKSG